MKQSVSLITLGVSDYEKANAFYAALGWQPVLEIEETAFFQANGVVLVLWAREKLAADSGIADDGARWGGITLAHNVGSAEEVDGVIEQAREAGGTITREPSETFYGGYAGVFRDLDGHAWEIAHNPGFGLGADGTRSRPTVLHLARRFRHRRAPETRRTIRPRRREAARVDVRHPLVGRNGRPARREPRHRRRLLAAARLWCRSRDHGCRQVRLPRMAQGPGVEGLVGRQPAVPRARFRPHAPPASVDRDGGRDDLPLRRRVACRGARGGPGGRGGSGRPHRWRRHRDPQLSRCRARRPHAHRRGTDPARPRRTPLGRA